MVNGRLRSGSDPTVGGVVSVQRLVRSASLRRLSTVATRVRKGVRLAMAEIGTKEMPDAENSVADLFNLVDQAEQWFDNQRKQADSLNPHFNTELRIFLAPEWFFRRGVPPYTHAEMRQIVEDIKTESAARPNWLIFAGTIYFGLGYDQASPPNVDQHIDQHFNLTNGAAVDPRPIRVEPVNPIVEWYVGNVCPVVYEGDLIHSQFKIHEHDIDETRRGVEKWAMFEFPSINDRRRVAGTNLFQHDGFDFALDICRDHFMCTAAREQADARSNLTPVQLAQHKGVDMHVVVAMGVDPNLWGGCNARDKGYFIECDGKGSGTLTVLRINRENDAPNDPALFDTFIAHEETTRNMLPQYDRACAYLADSKGQYEAYVNRHNELKEELAAVDHSIAKTTVFRTQASRQRKQQKRDELVRKMNWNMTKNLQPLEDARDAQEADKQAFLDQNTTFKQSKTAIVNAAKLKVQKSELGDKTAGGLPKLKLWPGKMYLEDA